MQNKKATISEIADRLNITASTVSRALNNNPRISEETIKKVKKMAKKLNYEPNNLASALRSGKSKVIGVILPILNRNFFSSVLRGIEDVSNSYNYKVIISQSYDLFENEVQAIDTLFSARVDGIIASIAKTTTNYTHFNKIIDRKIPLILFDRTNPKINTSQVVIDDYMAAYQMTQFLIQQGCKKIAHFTSFHKINIYKDRLRGYTDALTDNNIAVDTELIIASNLQLEDGVESMEKILSKKPDAVFSASDYAVVGAMQVLKLKNMAVPQQIALAGFGNEPFTMFTEPALSTVDQMSIEMGSKAAELLFQKIYNEVKNVLPQKIVLQPKLIFRDSTKKI